MSKAKKKVIVYGCDTCKRFIEIDNNISRSQIDKCIITLGCRGKITPQIYKNDKRLVKRSPHPSAQNWISRDEIREMKNSQAVDQKEELISLETGKNNQLSIIIPHSYGADVVTMRFQVIANESSSFTEYQFNRNAPVNYVTGTDSVTGKNLNFDMSTDDVRVYVNDEEYFEGTDWTKDTTSAFIGKRINFNSDILIDPVAIKVIVSPKKAPDYRTITFTKTNASSSGAPSAWANVDHVFILQTQYDVYTLDFDTDGYPATITFDSNSNLNIYDILADCPISMLIAPTIK